MTMQRVTPARAKGRVPRGARSIAACLAALAALAGFALLAASAANAAAPVQTYISAELTVEDQSVCGFGIRWDIASSGLVQLFLGSDGLPVSALAHVHEHNTLTNLTTGKTVSDDPVYEQMAHFENGQLTSVETMGLWVNAREGGDSVTDVGRVSFVVLPDGSRQWVFAAGQHPFREVSGGDLVKGLAAFCDLLS